jgi:hypothetical protein
MFEFSAQKKDPAKTGPPFAVWSLKRLVAITEQVQQHQEQIDEVEV